MNDDQLRTLPPDARFDPQTGVPIEGAPSVTQFEGWSDPAPPPAEHEFRFDPHTGQPVTSPPPGARFDPFTGKPLATAPRFDPMTGQRISYSVTRFIPRPPSGLWWTAQALLLGFICLALIGVFTEPGSRSEGVLGAIMIETVGAGLIIVISYAYRRSRRLP
jgi:hypothetical protein